jgi:outer membrane protein assembly factor BamD
MAAPDPNKDQRSGIEAMNAMQIFLNRYPGSEFMNQAIEVIDICQQKLERKGFENAKHYIKLRMYKAAVIAFDDFKKNFPDSKLLEEAAYLKIMAEFELAKVSIPSKQLERYTSTLDFYQELLDNFPNSPFLKEAQRYYVESTNQVNKLKNNKI